MVWDSGEPKRAGDGEGGERAFAAQGRATYQPDRNQRVNHQAYESRRQEPAAKINRRRGRKCAFMHGKGSIIGSGQHLRRSQGVDSPQRIARSVKPGRMKRVTYAGKIIANRFSLRRRRPENAKTGQSPQGRSHGSVVADLSLSGAPAGGVGLRHDPAQHIDEQTRQRQVRPGRISGHMEQHDETLAVALGGDQRRPVSETRPGFLRKSSLRLGEHLTGHRHLLGSGKAKEWAAGLERGDVPWALPGQCAAEETSPAAKSR